MPIHQLSRIDGCREGGTRSATGKSAGDLILDSLVPWAGRETSNPLSDQRLARQASEPDVGVLSASPFGPLAGSRNQQHRNATGPSYLQPQTADFDGSSDRRRTGGFCRDYSLARRLVVCTCSRIPSCRTAPTRRRLAGFLTRLGPDDSLHPAPNKSAQRSLSSEHTRSISFGSGAPVKASKSPEPWTR